MATTASPKTIRLLAEGRVMPATAPVQQFHVDGDTPGSRYEVFVGAHTAVCTCPSRTRCSHIDAAVEWVLATDRERALMSEALELRRARDLAAGEAAFALLGA